MTRQPVSLAVAGLGAIGRSLVERITATLPTYRLTAVSAGDEAKAKKYLAQQGLQIPVVRSEQLPEYADVVVECAPASAFAGIATPVLQSGKSLVTLSSGALVDSWHLVDMARQHDSTILVPSGALLALDAVQAVAEGEISTVRMVSTKPTAGLVGAPYLQQAGIDVHKLKAPTLLFEGTAREAVRGFPANLNVATALSLAGIGPDRTMMQVWLDPTIERNMHEIIVESDSARLEFSIQNIPSENPKTGRVTALSVIALLRKRGNALQIGT